MTSYYYSLNWTLLGPIAIKTSYFVLTYWLWGLLTPYLIHQEKDIRLLVKYTFLIKDLSAGKLITYWKFITKLKCSSSRDVARIFLGEGHVVSKWAYYPDCHGDLHTFCRGFIKSWAPTKLTGCERDLAINLPACFRLLFLQFSFIRKTKNAWLKNPTDLLHKNLLKPLLLWVVCLNRLAKRGGVMGASGSPLNSSTL